jgi:hypothetical protein
MQYFLIGLAFLILIWTLWHLLPRCPNDGAILDLATNYHLKCAKCAYIKHIDK